ncbi:ATP-dependent helicase HrpB [Parahaliea sp. F7430]|uniref:ATP-dependent helicase HrpB n=1 Tax=Sediminihaliea albiluteola TaxID=2758564 RepID=A0A7W2YIF8_9GAMM|nr:ATP-dependent helicase HrpB [Sediminihaliea albiluteola]MBA6412446.1 ATP-dependent helicase HrpB [Sediminihaliea albiluteola]
MPTALSGQLPITEALPSLCAALLERHEAVLQAPPGAGKTTLVPLEMLSQPWLAPSDSILLVEPRRIAARAAAARMAELLGEQVGDRVGYRIRLETCVSAATRIEVLTEGILARRLQSDPALEGVGLIIFDEFHERNLDSDLGLALALQAREMFREEAPLKLLAMSATLDADRVAALLDDAPLITSKGRQYPVEIHYSAPHRLQDSIITPTVNTVLQALREQAGSVLVFLPGQAEIKRVARELAAKLEPEAAAINICPLYGALPLAHQQQAIAPAKEGQRKVVLATNIAETSLTIEGIHTVVDSGLSREAVFDTASGITRLTTRRIARSSAEQRAGRAGRLAPGACYRLWSEEQHRQLLAQAEPEILQADLAPLALQLLAWGVQDPAELSWLDVPPAAAYRQAIELLAACEAVVQTAEDSWQLSPQGLRLAQMPLHPRLAHMLLLAVDLDATELGALLAALLAERNPLATQGADLGHSLALLQGDRPCPPELRNWYRRTWEQARRYAKLSVALHQPRQLELALDRSELAGVLLAAAYPDRIARLRPGKDNTAYQLSNGRSAHLSAEDSLCGSPWLATAEVGGRRGESADRIYSATHLNAAAFEGVLAALVKSTEQVAWDHSRERFIAERRYMLGKLVLRTEPMKELPSQARTAALLALVRERGLQILPWTERLEQWRARVNLLRQQFGDESPWPDLSDEALLASLEQWLLPWLDPVQRLQDFARLDLPAILQALLPWPLPQELEQLAPERITVPSGSSVAIDYRQSPPVLAVKLQEMFGCEEGPRICAGRLALCLHLLSPARRPLQVTENLASFWRDAYAAVRKEMRGRYPKHPWPEDPVTAQATRHTTARQAAQSAQ